MAKRSLLSMTQGILNAMDSDEISTISDTAEAQQVARVIEDVYWDLVDEHDLKHTMDLFSLEGLADTTKPTHMKLPDNVSKVEWIKYDKRIAVKVYPKLAGKVHIPHPQPLPCPALDTVDPNARQKVRVSSPIKLTEIDSFPHE